MLGLGSKRPWRRCSRWCFRGVFEAFRGFWRLLEACSTEAQQQKEWMNLHPAARMTSPRGRGSMRSLDRSYRSYIALEPI